jgi:hypothetical protein
MSRKLPVLLFGAVPKPTVDTVRAKLGGRAATDDTAGSYVMLNAGGGFSHAGIVIYARGDDVDVWTGEGVVRRARRDAVRRGEGPAPEPLAQVAVDAAVFGSLAEGQRVRYRHDTGTAEGTLVEKCKFGALVERDDRTIVGVSFRRLWPADAN